VIVAEPAANAVTSPLPFTLATLPLLLVQVTARPVSGFPLASFGVAASCTVCPVVRLAVVGLKLTDATGAGATAIAAVPLCPSLVAVIVAEPAANAVTSPLPLTVATAPLLLVQLTTRPVNELPFASFGVAASCTVCPVVRLAVVGLTLTDATGTLTAATVTAAPPLCPSLDAVIVAEPAASADTSPLPLTAATAPLLLVQVTTRPVSGFPLASVGVAASCTVCPGVRLAVAGLTLTAATGI